MMADTHTIQCGTCGAMLCANPEHGCALQHDEDVAAGRIHGAAA